MTDLITQIADHAEALCDPRQHSEPRWEWDHNRHRRPLPPHRTVVPGLITQLRELTEPGVDGQLGTGGGPETIPGNLDAVSLLASIEYGAAKRCLDIPIPIRETPEANIRALVGAAPRIDSDTLHVISRELGSWRNQAEIVAGWRQPPVELRAPCPALTCNDDGDTVACAARGTLLAAPDGSRAWCAACGATWDTSTIGVLARHVTAYRDATDARADVARARLRASRKPAPDASDTPTPARHA